MAALQTLKTTATDTGAAANTKTGAWTTANITAGNRIVLAITYSYSGAVGVGSIGTPTDTAGNTYTRLVTVTSQQEGGNFQTVAEIWSAPITVGGGTKPTISVTGSGGAGTNAMGWSAGEYSGLDPSPGTGCLDTSGVLSGAVGVTTDQTATTTGTAAASGSLIFALIGDLEDTTATWTVGSSSPTLTKSTGMSNDANAITGLAVAEGTSTAGATSSVTWHWGSTQTSATAIAVIRKAITRAAGFPTNNQTSSTAPAATWVTVGDLAIISIASFSASGDTISGISSTKVTGWTQVIDAVDATDNFSTSIWMGTINATGADTITVTWAGAAPTGTSFECVIDELNSGLGASNVWSIVTTGSLRGTASTPNPFPSLTSNAVPRQTYWGYEIWGVSATGGTGTGFVFTVTGTANLATWNPTLVVNTPVQPSGTGTGGPAWAAAGIISAALPSATTDSSLPIDPPSGFQLLPPIAPPPLISRIMGFPPLFDADAAPSATITVSGATQQLTFSQQAGAVQTGVVVAAATQQISFTQQAGAVLVGVAIAGATQQIAFTQQAGSVVTGVAIAGATQALTFTQQAGVVTTGVTVAGATQSLTFTQQAGTVLVGISVAGATQQLTFTQQAGTVSAPAGGATTISGVAQQITFQAQAGTVAAGVVVPGATQQITFNQQVGAVSTGVVVVGATQQLTFQQQAGSVVTGVVIPGATQQITFTQQAGTVAIGVTVAGATQQLTFAQQAGAVVTGVVVAGATQSILFQQQAGTVSAPAGGATTVTGVAQQITFQAGAGTVRAGVVVAGATQQLAFQASAGTVQAGVVVPGATQQISFTQQAGAVSTAGQPVSVAGATQQLSFQARAGTVAAGVVIAGATQRISYQAQGGTVTAAIPGHGDIVYSWGSLTSGWTETGLSSGWDLPEPASGWTLGKMVGSTSGGAMRQSQTARKYVKIGPVKATVNGVSINPTVDTVKMAFMQSDTSPQAADWKTADWETIVADSTIYARCLVGPGGTVTLTRGDWQVFVQIADTPEQPSDPVGTLTITA